MTNIREMEFNVERVRTWRYIGKIRTVIPSGAISASGITFFPDLKEKMKGIVELILTEIQWRIFLKRFGTFSLIFMI